MKWRPLSLRTALVLMILLATVPLVLLSCLLIKREVDSSRQQHQADLVRLAAGQEAAIEREIVSSIDALKILSRLDALSRGDPAAFHRALSSLPQLRPSWTSVYLVDAQGDVLLSSDQPFGAPLGNVAALADVVTARRTREPVISGLRASVLNGQPHTVIHVPVVIDGDVRYVLGVWMSPKHWRGLLEARSLDAGEFVALLDASGRVIAQAGAAPRAFADPLPAALLNAAPAEADMPGFGRAYLAWQRVPPSGWRVVAGAPSQAIDQRHRDGLVTAAIGGLLSLIGGLAMALLLARRVSEPLRRLARLGPPGARGPMAVREVAQLRDALATLELQRESVRERLQATADELQAVFETSPIGLAIARDAHCLVTQRNPALLAMSGDAVDGHGEPLYTLRHEGRVLEADEQPLQRAAAQAEVINNMELELVRPDGEVLKLLAHAQPLLDADGRPRGAVAGFVDITERVRTEQRLQQSRQMVDLAQQAGQVGFFDYDFERDEIAWTSGMGRLLGCKAEPMHGSWADWMSRIDGESGAEVTAARDAAADARAPELRFELRTLAPADGGQPAEVVAGDEASPAPANQPRWLAGRAVMTYADADAGALRMIGVVIDVTEQKRTESERAHALIDQREARLQAERANRAKDEFLAMLGHELRNPLGAIAAAAEVLGRAPDEKVADSARNIIARQTRNLARMMEDLLDVTRVIAGKITLARQPLDPAGAVERFVSALEMSQQLKEHRIELKLEPTWIEGDPTRVEQIVGNLLTNALKYTPAPGRVEVTVRRAAPWAVLEVSDNGLGMSRELMGSVFDLFVQGERSLDRRQGGLGIGLTLVQRLVELHGGTVEAASDGPDQGSRFTVRWPLIAAPGEERAGVDDAPVEPKSVVVVEDNADALDALKSMLELDGHTVRTAADGVAGLALIVQSRPDVALIDVGLPRLDGLEIATRLRARGMALRLVALSGYGQAADVDSALAAGFDSHLVKPVDPKALQRELKQV